jgi:hypothetical protein
VIAERKAARPKAAAQRPQWRELVDLGSRFDERRPEAPGCLEAPDRVEHQRHAHSRASSLGQRREEAPPDTIGAEPVHLEEHLSGRTLDRFEHRRERFRSVAKEAHGIRAHDDRHRRGPSLHSYPCRASRDDTTSSAAPIKASPCA